MADRAKRCSRVIKSSYIYSLLIWQPLFPPRSLRSSFPFRVHPAIRLFFCASKATNEGDNIYCSLILCFNKSSIYFESLCVIFYGKSNLESLHNAV